MPIVKKIINKSSQREGEIIQDKDRMKKSLKNRAARALKLRPPGSGAQGPDSDYMSRDNSDG